MFVVTADQKGSRDDVDRAGSVRDELAAAYDGRLALPVDRTAGDEVQALTADAAAALDMVLRLTRAGHWSVGLGIGAVRTPLPRATREATGPAFIAARDAVTAAKRSATRFALAVDPPDATGPDAPGDGDGDDPADRDVRGDRDDAPGAVEVEALITLLLLARDRRTPQGWEVTDRMAEGGSQRDVAAGLGITPQAVSTRLRTSAWRAERQAVPGLVALLRRLDARADPAGPADPPSASASAPGSTPTPTGDRP